MSQQQTQDIINSLRRSQESDVARAMGALMNLANDEESAHQIRECGGIPLVVSMLKGALPPPEEGQQRGEEIQTATQLRCAGVLLNLSVVDENREAVREEGGVEQLCTLIQMDSVSPMVKQYAVGALVNLCADDHTKMIVLERDAVKDVVALLRDDGNTTTQSYAVSALCALSSNEECGREMGEHGVIRAMYEACLQGEDLDAIERATGALWNLAVVEENRPRLRLEEERLIPRLLSLLGQAAAGAGSQEMLNVGNNCATTLGIMAADESNAKVISEGGILELLMDFMIQGKNDPEVLTSVCLALCNLAQRAENRVEIRSHVEWLQEILNALECGFMDVMEKATGCILTFSVDREVAKTFVSLNTIEHLVPLLSGLDPANPEQIELLRNIIVCFGMFSNDTDHKDRIREAGALAPLVDLLSHSSQDTEILEKVSGTLLNLGLSQENRVAIRQLDGIKPLVGLLDHPHERVQHNAAGAMWNLSIDNQNKMLIKEFGGLKKLLDKVKREAGLGTSGEITKRARPSKEKVEPAPLQSESFKAKKKRVVLDDSDDDDYDEALGDERYAPVRTGPPSRGAKSKTLVDSDTDDEESATRRTGPPTRIATNKHPSRKTKMVDSDDDDDAPIREKKRAIGPLSRGTVSNIASKGEDKHTHQDSSEPLSSPELVKDNVQHTEQAHTQDEEDEDDVLAEFDRFQQDNEGLSMQASMNLDKFLLDPKTVESFGHVIEEEEVEMGDVELDLNKPIPYSILENKTRLKRYPKGMDVSNREKYLSDPEFNGLFKMTKAEFSKQPRWKQTKAKKTLGLF